MKHFLYPRRQSLFAEARLIRMAGEMPEAPVDAPAKSVDNAKRVDDHTKAKGLMDKAKANLAKLKTQLDGVAKLKEELTATPGAKVDAAKAEKLGVVDSDTDDDIDATDVDARTTALEAEAATHQETIDTARTDMATSIDAIAQSGPAGKIDAAVLKMQNAMNGDGSLGEMLVAIAEVIKTLQDLFKGVDGSSSGGPESGKSGPAADRKEVKDMFDDAKKEKPGITDLDLLVTHKQTQIDGPPNPGKKATVDNARTALTAKQQSVVTEEAALAQLEGANPKVQADIDTQKVKVAGIKGEVEVLKTGLSNAEAELKKLESDIKKIKDAKQSTEESKDKFNTSIGAVRAALNSAIGKMKDGEPKDDLKAVEGALNGSTVVVDGNKIDLVMNLNAGTDAVDFQQSFIDQGVTNTAEFGIIPPGTKVGNPDALMKGIQQLIAKVGGKYAKK